MGGGEKEVRLSIKVRKAARGRVQLGWNREG